MSSVMSSVMCSCKRLLRRSRPAAWVVAAKLITLFAWQ